MKKKCDIKHNFSTIISGKIFLSALPPWCNSVRNCKMTFMPTYVTFTIIQRPKITVGLNWNDALMKKSKSLDYEFYTLESSNDSNKSIAKARKICITRENPGLLRQCLKFHLTRKNAVFQTPESTFMFGLIT